MARILVVEDDSTVRDLAVLYLQAGGHDVSAAADGAAGLAQAREELPDLIVSDVRMPQLDGFAMLTALRAADRTAHIPLIFLSALEDRQSLRLGMDLGADDFLAKPVRRDELLRSVEARLRRTRRLREVDTHSVANATVIPAPVGAPLAPAGAPSGRRVCKGTLVVITLRNALSMAQGLSATARRATLQSFFSRLRKKRGSNRNNLSQAPSLPSAPKSLHHVRGSHPRSPLVAAAR